MKEFTVPKEWGQIRYWSGILFSQNHTIFVSFLQVIVKNDDLIRWRRLWVLLAGLGYLFKEIRG